MKKLSRYNNMSDIGINMDKIENFGRFFKKMRIERRMTFNVFCDKANLAPVAVKGFEGGRRFPNEGARKRIANGLGITVEELYIEIENYFGTEAKFVEAKAKDMLTKKDKDKIVEYHASMHDDAGNSTPLVVKMKNDKVISVEKVYPW